MNHAMLAPGTPVGPFEIVALLGRGGMGEVYRARDTRLHRDVAIKVLPEAFTSHPARLERLEREARLLASLNHPNIASIYGLEEQGSLRALVLELVDGPTLADRLLRGPVAIEDALKLALQIAQALEAAHHRGVIHRDLKPSNIKLTADGQVKVLDFGLAKAFSSPSDDRQTEALAGPTETGAIVGTPAYMSPEQARGEAVGFHADIWAFGVVFYELLTGTSPFLQGSTAETLARVLDRQPDYTTLPANAPHTVRRLIRRCLEKDQRRRLQHIGDARLDLEEAIVSPAGEDTTVHGSIRSTPLRRHWTWIAAIVASTIVAAGAGWLLGRGVLPEPTRGTLRASMAFLERPREQPFGIRDIAISDDGTYVAYASLSRLWVHALDQKDGVAIGPLGDDPFFSPDGQWVGLFRADGVIKVPVGGGTATLIAPTSARAAGATWRRDGTIVFATSEGMFQVSANGGGVNPLVKPDRSRKESLYAWPQFLPGGQAVLFTIVSTDPDAKPQIALLNFESRAISTLLNGGSSARYVPTGHLVYASGTSLKAIGFDLASSAVRGDPVTLPDIEITTAVDNGAANFVVSDTGTLLFAPLFRERALRTLQWIDRRGKEEPMAVEPAAYAYPRVSPDGTRAAFERFIRGNRDIWILDLKRLTQTKLTDGPTEDMLPVWAPDGQRIWFASNRNGNHDIYSQAADGASEARVEFAAPGFQATQAFTPDGRRAIVYDRFQDQMVLNLDRPDHLEPLLNTASDERLGQISSDGKWLLYESDESGTRFEIMLRSFPDVSQRREKISVNGGRWPRWGPKGSNEVYYVSLDGGMMAASVTLTPTLTLGGVTKLFDWEKPPVERSGLPYDISPVDGRFLVTRLMAADPDGPTSISVVSNWFEQLRRQAPLK
ncbi:MAG TPA: protein kinase [Vicinamibacterales bacterium]